jgi:uncharacterized protein YegP (UPF0339 family)
MLNYLSNYEYLPVLFIIVGAVCLVLIVYFVITLLRSNKQAPKAQEDNAVHFAENAPEAETKQDFFNLYSSPSPVSPSVSGEQALEFGFLQNPEGRYKYVIKDKEGNILGTSCAYKNKWSCFKAMTNIDKLLNKNIIESAEKDLKFGKISVLLLSDSKGQCKFIILSLMNEFFESEYFIDKEKCLEALKLLQGYDFKPSIQSALAYIL